MYIVSKKVKPDCAYGQIFSLPQEKQNGHQRQHKTK